ncbi:MAG: HAMP domain-containing sensor histidine kinase [Actinomycetota bacterium]
MRSWRTLVLVATVAIVGALGTLAVGAASGMPSADLVHLAIFLAPAVVVTVLAMAIARPLLATASMRQRFVAIAGIATITSLANLAVLARLMFLSPHDASLLTVLLLYSMGSGIGAALVVARGTGRDLERLADTARRLGDGDLSARVGTLDAGLELNTLASTLDEMALRLGVATERDREIDATRRDLMTAVSHDLRTPLASLRAMIEAIDEGIVEDAPSMRRYASEMRRSITALSSMVDDLFELAQLDAGAIEQETRRARLDDVVRSAVATVSPQVSEKGLVLEMRLVGAEDAACSPRLERVLQNLLMNAVRHTPADGSVQIAARRHEGTLEVAVSDTGEGIAPEDLDRVFDPFFRSDPARSGGGAGLGLALAKRIVETLGGTIRADASPEVGARFAVEVPLD